MEKFGDLVNIWFLFFCVCVCVSGSQVLPTSTSSQMITFSFTNGGVATMRTSGTEPKIKYYTELCAAPGNRCVKGQIGASHEKSLSSFFFFPPPFKRSHFFNSDLAQLKKELDELVDAIIERFFEPEKNQLQPKVE